MGRKSACKHSILPSLLPPKVYSKKPGEEMVEILEKCQETFQLEFGKRATHGAFAPGRVNLIGEHIDYNDGFVLPMAIPFGTLVLIAKSDSSHHSVKTLNSYADLPQRIELSINNHPVIETPKWARYVQGVLANFPEKLPSLDILIGSTVPLGGGLSSSASLEVALFTGLEAFTGISIDPIKKALACQKAEHDYAKVPCGIMDQFIVSLGKEDHALLIDCRSLDWLHIPVGNPELVFLITNSNVRHELGSSEYAIRRGQCEEAANLLGVKSLRDASTDDLDRLLELGASDVIFRRARHVITEIKRTDQAAKALSSEDFHTFGTLMVESHASLRDDYEVSCPELDTLVSLVLSIEGVLGSRMTGGGFGGCTVTLVRKEVVETAIKSIKDGYIKEATFYVMNASAGSRVINLNDK